MSLSSGYWQGYCLAGVATPRYWILQRKQMLYLTYSRRQWNKMGKAILRRKMVGKQKGPNIRASHEEEIEANNCTPPSPFIKVLVPSMSTQPL